MPRTTPLGDYLRARRAQLQPGDVGLPDAGRRRTPGLRREEVATLAGISVDYLVRLEQGRDTNPSSAILAALAAALQLDDDERIHFWSLAARTVGHELCPVGRTAATIAPGVYQILERLQPTAALVLSPATDVLAANDAWRTTVEPVGLLDARPTPNLARYTFGDPRARTAFPDWERVADDVVGSIRRAAGRGPDATIDRLLDDLGDHPEFDRRWSSHRVDPTGRRVIRLLHPAQGEIRILPQELVVSEVPYLRLVTWLPANDASARALDRAAAPTRLRVVGN